jgi:hypothetical protein
MVLVLKLVYRPGVSIGDGCVIGAGAVVAKSVPAYHVAAGIPARVLRKVANNAPGAHSLVYETKDDRVVVCEPEQTSNRMASEIEHSSPGKWFDIVRSLQWLGAIKSDMPNSLGKPPCVAAHVSALFVAAVVGYWLGVSRLA